MFGLDRVHAGTSEDISAITGCTVVMFDGGARASAEVRGASPSTREIALLSPDKQMESVDAILLTGGSAFGLAAATGVVKFLSEKGIGYKTPWRPVPIVPAAVLFDLDLGSADRFPDEAMGYSACVAAMKGDFQRGSHGAGTGASVGKWAGLEHAMKSGQGLASVEIGEVKVIAIAAVNAVGDVMDSCGSVLAGAIADGRFLGEGKRVVERILSPRLLGTNTTLVLVATNARLSKVELNRVAQRGHDALARKVVPVHTSLDGDTVFTVCTDEVDASLDVVSSLAVEAIENAIEDAVMSAASLGGLSCRSSLYGKSGTPVP